MKLPPLYITDEYVEIPALFRSDATGEPFDHCLVCNRYLLGDNTQYLVEKAFRSYKGFEARDTIFEYALCMPCREQMSEMLSAESKSRIEAYFEEHVDFVARRTQLLSSGQRDVESWLETCLITCHPASELEEFQVFCECAGEHMLFTYLPYMVGGPAMDEIANLLSDKTIDELNGFSDEFLGLPPELEDIFTRRVVLF